MCIIKVAESNFTLFDSDPEFYKLHPKKRTFSTAHVQDMKHCVGGERLLKNVGISPKYSVTLLCVSQGQKLKPSSSPGILVSRAKGFKLKRHQPSEDNTVEKRREITIRCLIVYIGEKEEDLFKQYSDVEELNADLAMQVMKIAIIGDGPETIIVEESKILEGIDAARSCVLLMGVIYTLNLTYPKQLKFTFEVFQKLCLELDGQKASSKVTNLKLGIF
ncbi:uncharacterized protein [Nothobranchius furzeri]|uniref:uncharacterized protein n=1 Tax=Nothobranchius furzeri TaxID=105023 RepID=UPI003904DE8F